MKIIFKLAILSFASFAVSMQIVSAQTPKTTGDARIKDILDKLGAKYELLPDGDFKLLIQTENKRNQVVFIESRTEKLGNLEIRYISSPGYVTKGAIPTEIANKLLENSGLNKIAAWQVLTKEQTHMAIFTAKIAANSEAETVKNTLLAVGYGADAIEKELTGKDEF
ncbi:hypothetical protein NIES37_28570 [Tolypothrix tenuis PCC 7101]|uniref:Uncharacterized protein n=1 Tax=Tolypothrix tenuis PCC 7101 TaxID=231146 RepID=A0A1Z4MZI3_9CYAN|nr:hypothetical protein [Aulosira sp. FACHB-113]BAY98879.1 hypothetical protein NIES37_28570 [Tolypothrix tenuis PCC 7101]BAZ77202.1 hypothetical protein NIES50_58050 [Aulosira laxa NIES-50]